MNVICESYAVVWDYLLIYLRYLKCIRVLMYGNYGIKIDLTLEMLEAMILYRK